MAKERFELWGESLRELGVLLLVFVPLDIVVEGMHEGSTLDSAHWRIVTVFGLLGLGLMIAGVEIERRY